MAVTRFPQPEFIHPLYNPIRVDFDFVLGWQPNQPNEILENIRVEVEFSWGGTYYVESFHAFAIKNTTIMGAIQSFFELDLSGIIKPYSHPNSQSCSIPFFSQNDAEFSPHGKVTEVRIYTNTRLVSGVLQEDLAETIEEDFYINSAAINRWNMNKSLLAYYDATNSQVSSYARQFLTEDRYLRMSRNSTRWISLFQDAADNFRIILEYYAGTTLVSVDIDSQLGATGVCSIKINPSALPSYVKRFTIRALETNTGNQISQTKAFHVEDCDMKIPITWINELGGIDYYEFLGEQEGFLSSDSSFAAATPRNLSAEERGIFKVQANGKETRVIRDTVTYEVIDFVKYLQLTPEVYIFINGQWCNCVVLDAKFPTSDNTKPFYDIEITLQLNNPISQTN